MPCNGMRFNVWVLKVLPGKELLTILLKFKEKKMNWNDRGNVGGWELKMITWDQKSTACNQNGTPWCVRTNGTVGEWDDATLGWNDLGYLGGWDLNMLTFDQNGTMWCVRHNTGTVGKWNGDGWDDLKKLGDWELKMLAFDQNGTMWCVGAAGNVGKWVNGKWENQGKLGGWKLDWIAFHPSDPPGYMYCVGEEGDLGKYENEPQMLDVPQNWTLKMITFTNYAPNKNTFSVGADGNVGYTDEL